jgi:micrococcal nuclease
VSCLDQKRIGVNNFRALICCTIIFASSWTHGEPLPPNHIQEFTAKVIVVLDGDTVLVLRKGGPMKIRLAEIDAPEMAQPFGLASRNTLAEKVLHKQVWVSTLAVDKYGRIVSQLKVNGLSVNEEMVRRGMAWEYSFHHSDRRYIALQNEAKLAGRGLWTQNDPTPPWVWRLRHVTSDQNSSVRQP